MSGRLVLPSWLPTHEQRADAERARKLALLAERPYVVVRIAGNAGYDTMRCRRCRGKHSHLTLMCETQPFYGLSDALYAYWRAVGAAGSGSSLSPAQKRRLADLDRLFGPAEAWPDFAQAHPRTARDLGIGERDADFGALPIGVPEPISVATAQRLLDKINVRGCKPPLVVPGLLTNGRLGVLAPVAGA